MSEMKCFCLSYSAPNIRSEMKRILYVCHKCQHNGLNEMKYSLSICQFCVDSNIGWKKRPFVFILNLRDEKKFVRLFYLDSNMRVEMKSS